LAYIVTTFVVQAHESTIVACTVYLVEGACGVNVIQLKVFHVQFVVEKVQVKNPNQAGGVNDNVQVTKAKLSSVIGTVILVSGHIDKFQITVGVHIVGAVFAFTTYVCVILAAFQAASVAV